MRRSDHYGPSENDELGGPGWRHDKEEPHCKLFTYVSTMEATLAEHFDAMYRMEYLYNPADPKYGEGEDAYSIINENVVASCADTIVAGINTNNLRLRNLTSDGNWSDQRRAKRIELYAEGLEKQLNELPCSRVDYGEDLKWAFLKGGSLRYVGIENGRIIRPHIPLNEMYFDPEDCHYGEPNQLHWLTLVSKDRLKAMYPKFRKEIDLQSASSTPSRILSIGARMMSTKAGMVALLRTWALPIGKKGERGFVPGREVHCIESATLLDEEWKEDFYPFSKLDWSKPEQSWMPISGAGRIAGTQRALNRRNWQIETALDRAVMPVTYVASADANLAIRSQSHFAAVAVYKDKPPVTVEHPAVSRETLQSRLDLRESAHNEVGVSQLSSYSLKPAGIDSGVGLREYRDQTTQRYSQQEANVERHFVRVMWLTLWRCKQLGDQAPKVRRGRVPKQDPQIKWRDVDMKELVSQLSAASSLPRTPSGRQQLVLEWAQAGLISKDDALRAINHPDIERIVSLYTAALEQVEWALEMIAEGESVVPEPFMNLQMAVVKGQAQYLQWQTTPGVPEEVLEELRDFITMAAYMLAKNKEQQTAEAMPSAQMQQPPAQVATGMMPALPAGP